MTRSKSHKSKPTQRKTFLAMSTLTAAIGLALSANAQTTLQSATTESVKGRAPVVTIQGIVNETAAGRAPAPGDVVRVEATSTDPDADPIVGTDYRWTIDAAEVGTSQTYTVQPADVGDTLKVEVTARTNPANTDPASGMAQSTVVVEGTGTAPIAEDVAINGTPQVGTPLNGSYRFVDNENDNESGTTFQWYRASDASGNGAVPIPSTSTQDYTPTIADENMFLVFEVTPRSDRNPMPGAAARATTSIAVGALVGGAPTATPVSINGTQTVGSTLTVSYRFEDANNDAEQGTTFQWYRANTAAGTNAVAIEGATSLSHLITIEDENKFLIFEVTPRAASAPHDGQAVRVTTSAIAPLPGSAPYLENARIVGTPALGQTIWVEYDFKDADGDKESGTTYHWYRMDGAWREQVMVSGSHWTYPAYTLQPRDIQVSYPRLLVKIVPRSATGAPKHGNEVWLEIPVQVP